MAATETDEMMVVRYSIADAAIAEMRSNYMQLQVTDPNDKREYEAVHAARMEVKRKRCAIETERKALKARALEYGRMVDGEAKRLVEQMAPIEAHLDKQEHVYTEEQARKKAERERADAARLQDRINRMQAVNGPIDIAGIKGMSDSDFASALLLAKIAHDEAEEKRLAEEETRKFLDQQKAAEMARLAKAREEATMAKAEADAAKAAAEKAKRDAEEAVRAAEAQVKAERDKAEAVARAIREAEDKARREAEEKARRLAEEARAEEERKAKEEAMRPDREKIAGWANTLRGMADHIDGCMSDDHPLLIDAHVIVTRAAMELGKLVRIK